QANIVNSIQANGTNLLFISPGSTNQGGVRTAAGTAATLTLEDANALGNGDAPAVVAVAAEDNTGGQLAWQSNNVRTRITGVTSPYDVVRNVTVADGEWINEGEVTARSTVVVLGPTTATNLFGDTEAVGQQIKINGVPFRVIGVTAAKGGTGFG